MPRAQLVAALSLVALSACPDAPTNRTDAGFDTGFDAASVPGASPQYTEQRDPCEHRNPLRSAFFGDLHVHTSMSFDAYGYEVRTTPADAYRFARGEEITLGPYLGDPSSERRVKLDRPLDFTAVTDHAEFFGETEICRDSEAQRCVDLRGGAVSDFALTLAQSTPRRYRDLCGDDLSACDARVGDVWTRVQDAAESAYDRSAQCRFTSFVAYEYTNARDANNHHRNVIFRNAVVPARPITVFEEKLPAGLHRRLAEECLDADTGCDVLAIPHNANQSAGAMFGGSLPLPEDLDESEAASLQNRLEPLFEIYQHKGDMECRNGVSGVLGEPDEACDFEKLNPTSRPDCGDRTGVAALAGLGCISRWGYYRNVLARGFSERVRLGVNPFQFGVVSSTDTHNATAGLVDERDFRGHVGWTDDEPDELLEASGSVTFAEKQLTSSAGGLAGVWAVENSRDAIFEAMRRRETFGTSGPRIRVRLFGGDLPAQICDTPDFVEVGYERGVPMGGTLTDASQPPALAVLAFRDPGTEGRPGSGLQRIEIVRGRLSPDGQPEITVFPVASSESTADVDLSTCVADVPGDDTLCGVWTDPDFDSERPAYYYARVLEQPSCRWNTHLCNSLPESQRPASCTDPDVPKVIQERAWTSPIWYEVSQ